MNGSDENTLHQVANRLLSLRHTLRSVHGVPEDLTDELVTAAMRCTHVSSTMEGVLESLEFFRQQLDSGLARLRQECPPRRRDNGLDHLRPDAEGRYAWDRWEAQALAAGLAEDLASLGRAVMREAVQHDWDAELKAECGWLDAGQAMLELGLRDGPAAAERWQTLLETDGERGYWDADGSWRSFS